VNPDTHNQEIFSPDALAVLATIEATPNGSKFLQKIDAGTFSEGEKNQIKIAAAHAWALHENQLYGKKQSNIPYFDHLLDVANNVLEMAQNPTAELIEAALLHDAVEDKAERLDVNKPENAKTAEQQTTATETISTIYGNTVSSIVRNLTNTPEYLEESRQEKIAEKNALYIEHVAEAINDPQALIVKLADYLCNTRAVIKEHNGNFERLAAKYYPIVDIMLERLSRSDAPNLFVNLEKTRAELADIKETLAPKPQ
jgi:(p)ppGpp synthase/HD superfamily hydrolase